MLRSTILVSSLVLVWSAFAQDGKHVTITEGDDPKMAAACVAARENFRHFWKEVAHDRRRIIKAMDLAVVKAPFTDKGESKTEHMWLAEVEFDGKEVSGELQNDPQWLKSVKKGQRLSVPLAKIEDWMYVFEDEVYGGYTVNVLRAKMSAAERRAHDDAWGYKFGDPKKTRVGPPPKAFGKKPVKPAGDEHPFDETMAASLKDNLKKRPKLATEKDKEGWTLLHQEALAGNVHSIKALLEAGADPKAKTKHGMTARQLAESLGWKKAAELLRTKE
jgi:uncharacterized protein